MADNSKASVKIKIIGVGGGGGKAVNRMIEANVKGVEFIAIDTDASALEKSAASARVQIGAKCTQGQGAGALPNVGEEAADESREDILKAVSDADMVIVTAGMGGGTGTGAAAVVAECAREKGALTVAVVTRPFDFEGQGRQQKAELGLAKLRQQVDTLLLIPSDQILQGFEKKPSLADTFRLVDDTLCQGVRCVTDPIATDGMVNLDFADVKTVLGDAGLARLGMGEGSGENAPIIAAKTAIKSPLLETTLNSAKGLLLNVTGSSENLSFFEVNEAVEIIIEAAAPEANIIFGAGLDDSLGDTIRVTLVETGLEQVPKEA